MIILSKLLSQDTVRLKNFIRSTANTIFSQFFSSVTPLAPPGVGYSIHTSHPAQYDVTSSQPREQWKSL